MKHSSTLASWHVREISLTSVLNALGRGHFGEGVDYRAREERRNEVLTKR